MLSHATTARACTALFARHSLFAALAAAVGAQAAALRDMAARLAGQAGERSTNGPQYSASSTGGGFSVQSLLALWPFQRHGLPVTEAGTVFPLTGLLSACSQPAAAPIAARFGLINTMVYTHLPANLCLALVPFMSSLPHVILLLFVRSALGSMDVPARVSYMVAVVSAAERPAAASITNVPRSLVAALSPALAGYMLTISSFGWPLVVSGL